MRLPPLTLYPHVTLGRLLGLSVTVFHPWRRNVSLYFLFLAYLLMLQSPRMGRGYLTLQSTYHGRARGPKCCTSVGNNISQTILCFWLHRTIHNRGNTVWFATSERWENLTSFPEDFSSNQDEIFPAGRPARALGGKARLYPILQPDHQYLIYESVSFGREGLQERLSHDKKITGKGNVCFEG